MLSARNAAPYAGPFPTACFSVVAEADPGIMPRVMALFAKRGLLPDYWCSRVFDRELTVDLQMTGMDRDTAAYIAACFRQMPGVRTVLTSEKA
jgi:hypothetical protein